MDFSENALSESDLIEEADEESEDSKVSFGDCLAATPRAFLESLELGELILFLPAIVSWLLLQFLSSVYFLFAIALALLAIGLYGLWEDDTPRSLFSYDSEPPDDGLSLENRP